MTSAGLVAASHAAATSDISIGHLLLQLLVAMVIIVGGIWGFSKLANRSRAVGRRAGRKAGGLLRHRSPDHGLTVLSRQPLGKGKCLAVVEVGTQQFLVGIADSGLTPLGELRPGGTAPGTRTAAGVTGAPLTTSGLLAGQATLGGAARGTGEFSALDLRALGDLVVAPEDVRTGVEARAVHAGRAYAEVGAPAHAAAGAPAHAARVAPAHTARADPTRARLGVAGYGAGGEGAAGAAQGAESGSRSMRGWVDALREATVRR